MKLWQGTVFEPVRAEDLYAFSHEANFTYYSASRGWIRSALPPRPCSGLSMGCASMPRRDSPPCPKSWMVLSPMIDSRSRLVPKTRSHCQRMFRCEREYWECLMVLACLDGPDTFHVPAIRHCRLFLILLPHEHGL